jgi:hypothetical protein
MDVRAARVLWLVMPRGSNSVLHHAAQHAPTLLREARRVSRRWIVLIEDVLVKHERNPRERHIHMRHKE